MRVVIIPEFIQLLREVDRVPEEHAVEIFAANGADQPFDERMRNRNVGNRLDLLGLEYTEVGEPTVETEQRIVVGADVLRSRLGSSGAIEHPANRDTVNICAIDTKTDEPAREDVHDHQHPVTAQEDRFAAEEIKAP